MSKKEEILSEIEKTKKLLEDQEFELENALAKEELNKCERFVNIIAGQARNARKSSIELDKAKNTAILKIRDIIHKYLKTSRDEYLRILTANSEIQAREKYIDESLYDSEQLAEIRYCLDNRSIDAESLTLASLFGAVFTNEGESEVWKRSAFAKIDAISNWKNNTWLNDIV